MEANNRPTATAERENFEFTGSVGDGNPKTGLETVEIIDFSLNGEEFTRQESERDAARLMKNPLPTDKAVAYFGAMLGLFPPFAIFCKIIFQNSGRPYFGLIFLFLVVNAACVVTGYIAGKNISRVFSSAENFSWNKMLVTLPFIGILWGMLAGGAGGLLIFGIGAIFGAIIAAAVGAIAFPAFGTLHRLLKSDEMIEEKHFFPIALGITATITAFIMGI